MVVAGQSGHVTEAEKAQLRGLLGRSDPVIALIEIRAAQAELGRRVDRRGRDPAPVLAELVDLAGARDGLRAAVRQGEQRPTHRRPYRRTKPVPVRSSMLDPFHQHIELWLETQPTFTGCAGLERLIEIAPDRFTARHLRTVQRFVKVYKLVMVTPRGAGPSCGYVDDPSGIRTSVTFSGRREAVDGCE